MKADGPYLMALPRYRKAIGKPVRSAVLQSKAWTEKQYLRKWQRISKFSNNQPWQPNSGSYSQSDNPIHSHTIYFFQIHFNNILPYMLRSPKWNLSFRIPSQNFVLISHLPQAFYKFCPHHPHQTDHLIILGQHYKLWHSFLSQFIHHPVTSSPLSPNISSAPNTCSSVSVRNQVS